MKHTRELLSIFHILHTLSIKKSLYYCEKKKQLIITFVFKLKLVTTVE